MTFAVRAEEAVDINVAELSDEALEELYTSIFQELVNRGLKDDTSYSLPEGKYIIGQDIVPGSYVLTCTSSSGDAIGDAYASLGNMMDSLGDGSTNFGDSYAALGGAMSSLVSTEVSIIGDYGTVLKSYSLKPEETVQISLEEKTALEISGGACKLTPVQ